MEAVCDKILLVHKQTGLYFQSPGNWVESEQNASTFLNAPAALRVCFQQRLTNIHIVLKSERYPANIVLVTI